MGIRARSIAIALLVFAPAAAYAGPAEDADAAVARWAATFAANDTDALVKLYAPDAVLLGTISPIIADKPDLVREYFKRRADKVEIGDHRTLVLGDDAVLVTGFYEFSSIREGKPVLTPARFTMIIVKRDGDWLILHHHSSRRPEPTQ